MSVRTAPRVPPTAGTEPVTFVMSHLEPAYGIERAAAALVTALSASRPVRVVVAGGRAPDRVGDAPVTSVGLRLGGTGRLLTAPRLRGVGAGPGVVVLVGAWVAVPWLLANLGRSGTRDVVVWEHSFTRARVARGGTVRLLWQAARLLYRRSRLVVAPGPATSDLLCDRLRVPVTVIPNVVAEGGGCVDAGEGRDGVLLVGRLEAVKRPGLALRAFAASGAGRLTVVGDGAERPALERLAAELGVADRVTFVGAVPRDHVLALMRRSALLLHTAEVETFGLVYLEAASCGLPVVSAVHPAARDVVPEAAPGVLVGDDVASLGAAVDDVLRANPSSWDWAAAREVRAARFAQQAVVEQWTRALEAGR